jgi:hypothetical protein
MNTAITVPQFSSIFALVERFLVVIDSRKLTFSRQNSGRAGQAHFNKGLAIFPREIAVGAAEPRWRARSRPSLSSPSGSSQKRSTAFARDASFLDGKPFIFEVSKLFQRPLIQWLAGLRVHHQLANHRLRDAQTHQDLDVVALLWGRNEGFSPAATRLPRHCTGPFFLDPNKMCLVNFRHEPRRTMWSRG